MLFALVAAAPVALAQQSYPVGQLPVDVAVGDWNGDGLGDAVTADWTGQDLTLLLGNGGGALVPVQSINGFGLTPSSVAAADVDLDGRLDVVAGMWSAQVVIYQNTGGALFNVLPWVGVYSSVNEVQVADLNLDGLPDLVTANNFQNCINVSRNFGNGTFSPAVSFAAVPSAVTVDVGHFNHDGYPDVVVGGFNQNSLAVLLGDGSFGFFGGTTFYTNNLAPHVVEVEDFDLDGNDDVLCTWGNLFGVQWWAGNGNGVLSPGPSLATLNYPGRATAADVNKDGIIDVACTSSGGYLYSFAGAGGWNFNSPATVNLGTPSLGALRLADLEHNGSLDFVMVDSTVGVDLVWVFKNTIPSPPGIAAFGTGTPGCRGMAGMNANQKPTVGNASFAVTCTNVPAHALGLGLAGNAPDFAGTDIFSVGVLIHFDLLNSTDVQVFDIYSDGGGAGFAPVPIPNDNSLQGQTYYASGIFVEDTANGQSCSTSVFDLLSTRGLAITIL